MTKMEFLDHYKKLLSEYPQQFESKYRMELIEKTVIGLPVRWWESLVERIIITNNPRLDIHEAAAGERRALNSVRRTQETLAAYDVVMANISDSGLGDALRSHGAKCLWEAIVNTKPETTKDIL